jgi:hypothetical protein
VNEAQLGPEFGGDPGEHVTVGGEVVVVGDQVRPAGAGGHRRTGKLVEIHGGRVADEHLPGSGPEQVLAQ